MFKYLAVLAALLAAPASGQTISPNESANFYANTRGWAVFSISDGRGLNACRAVRGQGYYDQIIIEYDGFNQGWELLVHGSRPTGGGVGDKGAAIYFDGRFADRQMGFGLSGADGSSDTHAKMFMTPWDLAQLKAGNTLRIDIAGEQNRSWSLSGSTAAILKTAECAASFGFAPAGMSAAPAQKQRPAAPVQQATVDGNNVGYVVFPKGQFRHTGNGNWVEEGNNGSVLYFKEYLRDHEKVLLNDASRNLQIWIQLPANAIGFTTNYNDDGWAPLYSIECFDTKPSRSC